MLFLRVRKQPLWVAQLSPSYDSSKIWPRLAWVWRTHSPPGQLILPWPEVSDLHHGASSPYGTPRVSLQHGSWGPTASDLRKPGGSSSAPESSVSLYRLTSLGLGGTAWAVSTKGQAHWCQHEALAMPITTGEAAVSPQAHTSNVWRLGRFLRYAGVGGMGPPLGQWAACTSQSWKGLAHPQWQMYTSRPTTC